MARWGAGAWYGVDFDGTLVETGQTEPGEWRPIMSMVERVRRWLADGVDVHIVTARVHSSFPDAAAWGDDVRRFCEMFFGRVLPVRCDKDGGMVELWDDRARQVETNTGVAVTDAVAALREIVERVDEWVEAEAWGEIVDSARRALGLPESD